VSARLQAIVDGLDTIFAVRVGLFHREPARAHRLAERWLAPGGAVFAFLDEPTRA